MAKNEFSMKLCQNTQKILGNKYRLVAWKFEWNKASRSLSGLNLFLLGIAMMATIVG